LITIFNVIPAKAGISFLLNENFHVELSRITCFSQLIQTTSKYISSL